MASVADGNAADWDVVIIGAGMAGLSTAIWARRLGLSAMVLEQEGTAGGQLQLLALPVIDYPGLEPIPGAELAARLRRQAEAAGAVVRLDAPVTAVEVATGTCQTPAGPVRGRALVLATGLTPRRLGVPGEQEAYRLGLVRRPSLALSWFQGKTVAVIGGGDRAAENALLLSKVAARVCLIHRRSVLRAREAFQRELRAAERVQVLLNTQVTAIAPTPHQATLCLQQGEDETALTVEALCIYIGNRPRTELVAGQVALTDQGYAITDRSGRTSAPGLYAVGDVCTPPEYQSLSTAAGQAMAVAKQIALALLHPSV
jgi:thioredoxin reductase (NADPH)